MRDHTASRRHANLSHLLTVGLLATGVALAGLTGCATRPASTATASADAGAKDPRRASPDAALAALRAGNERFIAGGSSISANAKQRVAATAAGQYPVAAVFGCADSRTPPELIFDLGVGEVFTCRVAGVASGVNDVASLEYANAVLGVPLIVVMGHTECGAMKAAIADKPLPGSLPKLADQIRPAVAQARKANPGMDDHALLDPATRAQVMAEIQRLLATSPVLRESVSAGKLKIVGAIYDLKSGGVTWLGEHPQQAVVLAAPIQR
ncbi:MAG: carbonic anhydrase [Phycisphaerales bacterium]